MTGGYVVPREVDAAVSVTDDTPAVITTVNILPVANDHYVMADDTIGTREQADAEWRERNLEFILPASIRASNAP
jgi:hypothetical protein